MAASTSTATAGVDASDPWHRFRGWTWTRGETPLQRILAAVRSADEVTAVTIYFVLLFGLPERLTFPPLGAFGAPATVWSMLMFAWWVGCRIVPGFTVGGKVQPIRQALVVLLCILMTSYVIGVLRGLEPVLQRGADRFMLGLFGYAGVTLVIADGLRTRERLDTLAKRMTLAGAGLALMGLVQQFTGFAWATFVRVPGLSLNHDLASGITRGFVDRINGTANHPIGYAVPLALLLPLALHYALAAEPGRDRQLRSGVAIFIAAGIPLAISRSAIVAEVVALLVVWLGWSWRRRINAVGIAFLGLIAYQVMVPGRLVTLFNIFTKPDEDLSVTARTKDYETVFNYLASHRWFGLGPGVFLPDEFIQLDNQVLKFLLEIGLIGTLAFLLLYVTAGRLAAAVQRVAVDDETRQLATALLAIVCGAFVTCFTFDSYSFGFYVGVLWATFGLCGALWRLTLTEHGCLDSTS